MPVAEADVHNGEHPERAVWRGWPFHGSQFVHNTNGRRLEFVAGVFANGEVQFSSYTLPARLVVTHLGTGDSSEQELTVAFQLNRRRIVQAVVEAPLLRRPARG
jgi:hypothetical protein